MRKSSPGPNFRKPVSLRTALKAAKLSHDTNDHRSSHEMREYHAEEQEKTCSAAPSQHLSRYLTTARSHGKPGPMVISCMRSRRRRKLDPLVKWGGSWFRVFQETKIWVCRSVSGMLRSTQHPSCSQNSFSPGGQPLEIYDRRNYGARHPYGSQFEVRIIDLILEEAKPGVYVGSEPQSLEVRSKRSPIINRVPGETPRTEDVFFSLNSEIDVSTTKVRESLMFSESFVGANAHYHLDDPGAGASTNTRKRGTYAGGGTLERSVRSVGRCTEKARPGWKLRAAGDYVDRRKNKLRIGLSTRCCTAWHLPHLPAVAGVAPPRFTIKFTTSVKLRARCNHTRMTTDRPFWSSASLPRSARTSARAHGAHTLARPHLAPRNECTGRVNDYDFSLCARKHYDH
ncbi:hypothetical protein DBV15_09233 [Temnothorax longispinosus]|uniref:Uncharacterized protein n=1 Tax=Temnothorax longispinosus TaxID=300112 RepID=A0A4S2KRH2_9HYME|nr:hypothetical protein DBV15_09233 [Temnothorax longispinosus]